MKRFLKHIGFFFLFIPICAVLILQCIKYSLQNSTYFKTGYQYLQKEIKKSDVVPNNFIEVYNSIHPITNTNGVLFDKLRERYARECPCYKLAIINRHDFRSGFKLFQYTLAKKLEKEFTQQECLNLYVRNFDFLNGTKGIKNASDFYFKKSLKDLNFDENATLVLMLNNPSLYNPIRHPEKLKKRLNTIKRKNNIPL